MPPLTDGWAFFLDVDGTLLDLVERPDAVRADAHLLCLVDALSGVAGGAVALITGRSLEDVDRLFAPMRFPVAAQHGAERRSAAGSVHRHDAPVEKLGQAAVELARLSTAHEGLVVEYKGITLALHYRAAPSLGDLAFQAMRSICSQLDNEFVLQPGKFLVEIRPSGKDKGEAIAEFMYEEPFLGRLPVFVGDDMTDEQGFRAVNRAGGHSVKVGPGATEARWRLPDALSVRQWLDDYVKAVTAHRVLSGDR